MGMKNRIDLAKYFGELGLKTGAEIGVFGGHYSEILFDNIPGLKLYCVDPWMGYQGYRDHKFESSFRGAEALARERLEGKNVEFIKKFSVDAAAGIPDGSLDFVYIDGNHTYPYVKQDLEVWAPKVRTGGIVSGDDYYVFPSGNVGVIQAVGEYVKDHNLNLHIIPADKITHVDHDDRQPQFWWVK